MLGSQLWRLGLAVYLLVDVALVGAAALLPAGSSWVPVVALMLVGAGVFAVGVWKRRPEPHLPWWLLVVGALLFAAMVTAGQIVFDITGRRIPWAPVLLLLSVYPFYITGLALLERPTTRSLNVAATVDASLVALSTYLGVFAAVVRPNLGTGWDRVTSIITPLAALIAFAMILRIVFAGGIRSLSVGVVLLALVLRSVGTVALVVPTIATTGFGQVEDDILPFTRGRDPLESPILGPWVLYSVLIGAGALHPSFGQARPRREEIASRRTRRVTVVATLSAAVITGWLLIVSQADRALYSDVGFTIPVVLSVAVIILIVTRLALTARLAHRNAAELDEQSGQLAGRTHELESLQSELRYRASHDALTGLANRATLAARLDAAMSRPAGSTPNTVALVNLDSFKDVNDARGHVVGDELLVQASRRLAGAVAEDDALARLGGDEFAVLLTGTPEATAVEWANDIRETLHRPYLVANNELFLTASIGVATVERESSSDALRNAGMALHAAKAAGKNQVVVFRSELESARESRAMLGAGLQHALANDELSVEYQPVCELSSYRIVGVEALLRWTPRGHAAVPPSEFIPVAEETGQIAAIGAWVMREACRSALPWYHRHGVSVGVNVSARQLDDVGFPDMVLEALDAAGLPTNALVIELTESSLVSTTSESIDGLFLLRDRGIRIAMDDFGTGYSSLASVSRLPVDVIKIDKSFIHDAEHGGDDRLSWGLIHSIIQMAKPLGKVALAEGVETIEQADMLRELQCPYAQGYLFGRPVPAEQLDGLLATSDTVDPRGPGRALSPGT